MASSTRRVPSVTTARAPRSEDRQRRARQYYLAMTVRTVCFVAACVTATFTKGPLLWTFVAMAVILPYVAVVIANATNYTVGTMESADAPRPRALPTGTTAVLPQADRSPQ